MAEEMPFIPAINIFGHTSNCRNENKELLQSIHLVYDKEPRNVAIRQLSVFNIQLPYLNSVREELSNPFYCWCRLLYEMHFNNRLPAEIYAMEP
jgi:hypothetical protein